MVIMTKQSVSVIILISVTSLLINQLLSALSTEQDLTGQLVTDNEPIGQPIVIGDALEHIMWFLQITDIHICLFNDRNRTRDLELFCEQYLDIIEPSVVLATGDLTNSASTDPMGTHREEWLMYSNAMKKCNVSQKTDWLDIRGNHDMFNVMSWDSHNNYFRELSVTGPNNANKGSYKHRITKGSDTYSFIGLDACRHPALKRPYTFFCQIEHKQMDQLKSMRDEERDTNYTVWFGHYPTSAVFSPSPGIRQHQTSNRLRHWLYHQANCLVWCRSGPYLCGHFHSINGMVPHMYSTQASGYLELELSDWKESRALRLAAVDHGLFTFIDFHLHEWPIILITNPKNALYSLPNTEPSHRVSTSTHIRALVFSKARLESVKTRLNDNKWTDMRHISGPLYVLEWNPSDYDLGLHTIEVTAEDSAGNERTVGHQFSVDGTKQEFPLSGRLILRLNIRLLAQILFTLTVFICVVPLVAMRYIEVTQEAENSFFGRYFFKTHLLAKINKIYYPLLLIPIYACIGPWYIGDIVGGRIGVCFVWGIFVDGFYIPDGVNYIFGTILLSFQTPITWCLSSIIYERSKQLVSSTGKSEQSSLLSYIRPVNLCLILVLCCHIFISTRFYYFYGLMTYLLGFFNTWSSFIYLALWLLATRVRPDVVRPSKKKMRSN